MLTTRHYFANAVGSVDFVPKAYVYLHWSGKQLSSLEFRALYVHARNLLRRNRLTGILADHRAMPDAPAEADREWLLNEWLPQTMEESALARYAVLPAPAPENRLHTDHVLKDLRRYLTVKAFDDMDAAVAWVSTPQ
ncbi:hypothetical protein [Hymenobacter saemangeumensis]|uniref:hypothetical protein n=1 Tax=Hymenobacter saemangeumensis TaxID=1084522 RepID=UPI0031E53F6F